MRRGTRVGQAYVAVTADGSGINEEIVNSVDSAGDGVDKSGDDHGRRYGDHFGEGFRSRMEGVRKKIGARLGMDLADAGDDAGNAAGDRAGTSLSKRISDKTRGLGDKIGERLGDEIGHSLAKRLEPVLAQLGEDIARTVSRNPGNVGGGGGRRGDRDSAGLGVLVGGLLGAGSRNNALNAFGKSIGGIVSLVEKLTGSSKKMFSSLVKGFSEAEEGANFFQKALSGGAGAGAAGAEGLAALTAGAPAAAAAIGIVTLAMSVLVSISSALLAIATALTATIVSGLTAGVLVLGGALSAAAAAGGLLVVAFTSMTDAQRKMLTTAFHPLKAELTGIGQIVLQDLIPAFDTWSSNLQQALALAVPVAHVMGAAFAEAGNILTASLSGPGFQNFANALTIWLPGITENLSAALGGFLNGITGVFAALLPLVNRFSIYLEQVANRFAIWANTAAGQNAIVDFTERAVEALKSLSNFVFQFSGFVARILFSPEAQNFGNSMFDSLANSFERLRKRIDSGDLERWFADAKKFGAQLWSVLMALADTFAALNNSGVLQGVGNALEDIATIIDTLNNFLRPAIDLIGNGLPYAISATLGPISQMYSALDGLVDKLGGIGNVISKISPAGALIASQFGGSSSSGSGSSGYNPLNHLTSGSGGPGQGLGVLASNQNPSMPDLSGLINMGNTALSQTDIKHGGTKKKPKYVNPYVAWANSLIKNGPSISAQVRNALLTVNKQVAAAVRSASSADSADAVQSALRTTMANIRTSATATVNNAQQALNNAATSLANATSKSAATKALAQVKKAQRDLSAALKNQTRINAVAKSLAAQRIVTSSNVKALLNGVKVQNATLADYAAARNQLADKLTKANQKLADAIALRDNYKSQVIESVKSFGSILTAQAKTINGVEQALTFGDITSNLEARLAKIKAFQDNLRILLAEGLSNEAYQQLVDGGVEQSGAYAAALVSGGQGAVSQVNDLLSQINGVATQLGGQASDRLYQAGVDAAKGLVDGLTSLSKELDSAATKLGNAIAKAIAKALGIHSPSKVLYSMMDDVGDGASDGLDNQHTKVGRAGARLASKVAVSPEAAAYKASVGDAKRVSGNSRDPRFRDLIVHTPTENPEAVAMEVLNEVTGRLP